MNEARTNDTRLSLKSVYTRKAGKQVKYIGRFFYRPNPEADGEEIEIRKTHVRYAFVAVHRYLHDSGDKQGFSFHCRRDLAEKSSNYDKDKVIKVIEVNHLADAEAHEELKPKAEAALTRIEQFEGEKNQQLKASESHLRDYLAGELYAPEAIEARLRIAEKQLPAALDGALKARVATALDCTNNRTDWTKCVKSARERLARFLDGDFIPGHVVKIDLENLETLIGKIQDSTPSSFDANAQEMDEAIEAGLQAAGYIERQSEDVNAELGALEHTLAESPDQETIERDTLERVQADARGLGDQWIAECLYELNLKIVLAEISEGERQVLKGILEQVRAGRKA